MRAVQTISQHNEGHVEQRSRISGSKEKLKEKPDPPPGDKNPVRGGQFWVRDSEKSSSSRASCRMAAIRMPRGARGGSDVIHHLNITTR